jgi:peptidoglycan/xylan/chitin deacetylase (PgdA/CDA1 family)
MDAARQPETSPKSLERPLERLLRPVETAPIDDRGDGASVWLRAGSWRVFAPAYTAAPETGELIERFVTPDGAELKAVAADDGVFVPFNLNEAYTNYVSERWRQAASQHRLSTRQLQLYYRVKHLLPRGFWLAARRMFIRLGKPTEFPAWPYDGSVDRLLRFYGHCLLRQAGVDETEFAWFWPRSYRAAVILTHDVETEQGLRLALEIADVEEVRGLRSSFNIVGGDYPIDYGIVRELMRRGFEVGLHGLVHDRSLFSSRQEFERQLPLLGAAAERLGTVGFRSPATYRVSEWLHELPADYDCTVPLSDPYEPQPGGSCSIWPFMLDGIVELPYTLPQDHTLFTLLRQRSADTWIAQMDAIVERFGLVECLSHPDRGYLGDRDKRAHYIEFLDAVRDKEDVWKALPRDVADWWRRRDAGATDVPEQLAGTIIRRDAPEYAELVPPTTRGGLLALPEKPVVRERTW